MVRPQFAQQCAEIANNNLEWVLSVAQRTLTVEKSIKIGNSAVSGELGGGRSRRRAVTGLRMPPTIIPLRSCVWFVCSVTPESRFFLFCSHTVAIVYPIFQGFAYDRRRCDPSHLCFAECSSSALNHPIPFWPICKIVCTSPWSHDVCQAQFECPNFGGLCKSQRTLVLACMAWCIARCHNMGRWLVITTRLASIHFSHDSLCCSVSENKLQINGEGQQERPTY
mmetsp:Transcript_52819/g.88061  ORF Transcript_52819/g.88061 Transcript_52819/m.88061 type:complete len:224 (-) Transcript_52819:68-739(-)